MKIAVTGASGFIGRRIVAELLRRGHAVTALAGTATTDHIAIDLRRPETLDALAGHDAVVHGGAYVPKHHADPGEARACLEVNALGTLAVLEAAKRLGVRHVVYMSGGNIYRLGETPLDESGPIDPSHRAVYYLTSKACGDFYASHFDREGLAVGILRPSAVYGPGIARSMIATFTTKLLAGEAIRVDDGGRYRADFVEVDDVARATAEVIARGIRGPLNLGGGTTTSSLEIANLLADLTGASLELVTVGPATSSSAVGFSPLDIERARTSIAYTPTSIRDGLARYVAHRRDTA